MRFLNPALIMHFAAIMHLPATCMIGRVLHDQRDGGAVWQRSSARRDGAARELSEVWQISPS